MCVQNNWKLSELLNRPPGDWLGDITSVGKASQHIGVFDFNQVWTLELMLNRERFH